MILEAFFSLVLLLFLRCNPCFCFTYKRGSRAPMKGDLDPHETEPRDKSARARHEHTAEQRSSSQHPFIPFTRDLGPLTLSPVCNPYYKSSAGNTSSNELDVGTFRPNQYKPLCPLSTPSKLDTQIQIYSSVVRKHRQNCSRKCISKNSFSPTGAEIMGEKTSSWIKTL